MYTFLLLALNSLMLLTIVALNTIVGQSVKNHNLITKIIYGVIFSILLYVVMSFSYVGQGGLVYDSRSILLGFITLFYSPISVTIATVSALLIRFSMGGIGIYGGFLEILFTVAVGVVWRIFLIKRSKNLHPYFRIWLYSFSMQLVIVAFQFILPVSDGELIYILKTIVPPMLFVYPLIMVAIAAAYYRTEKWILNSEELKKSEEQYRTLFESVPSGMIQYDTNGIILSCNDAFASILDTVKEEVQGLNMLDLPDSIIVDIMTRSLKGESGEFKGPYTSYITGRETYVDVKFSGVYDVNGKIIGGSAMVEDLTSIRRKELENIDFLVASLFEKSPREKLHSERVSFMAAKMGKHLNLDKQDQELLETAAILHDIGKLNIDEAILEKNGPLSFHEYSKIKNHVQVGYRVLSKVQDYQEIAEIVLHHHERWDGNGYPDQLTGEETPFFSRIICVCDSYDAMTNVRPYRQPLSKVAAMEEITKNMGTQFDPEIAKTFLKVLENDEI